MNFNELHIYNSRKIKKELIPLLSLSEKIKKIVINFKTYTPFSNSLMSMLGKKKNFQGKFYEIFIQSRCCDGDLKLFFKLCLH